MSRAATLVFIALLVSCGRERAATVFQPTLYAGDQLARERFGGDIIVFVCDGSRRCTRVRHQVFESKAVADFIAANFAAVEVPAGTDAAREALKRYRAPDRGPQIIIASPRLENLRLHVRRLDQVTERTFLEQLRLIKEAKTVQEVRKSMRQ